MQMTQEELMNASKSSVHEEVKQFNEQQKKQSEPSQSSLSASDVAVLAESISDMVLVNGLTFEQEQFAMAYIDTGKAQEAYERVYGRVGSKKEIAALLGNPNVIKRVSTLYNQIMGLMQMSCQVDVDLLVRELEQARQLAISEREASAAIAATMGKAKLHGLMVDRKEISMKRPEDMTEAELRQVLGAEFEQDLKASRSNKVKVIEG